MSGSAKKTGSWDPASILLLKLENGWWTVQVNLQNESLPLDYKYGVYDTRQKTIVHESGQNRGLHLDLNEKTLHIVHDGFVRLPNDTWKGSGVSLPVFSLRSKDSFGVGEFSDLKLLLTGQRKRGMKMIQLLPVNDTILPIPGKIPIHTLRSQHLRCTPFISTSRRLPESMMPISSNHSGKNRNN